MEYVSLASFAENVFATGFDTVLFLLVFMGELGMPFGSYGKTYRAERHAHEFIDRYNWETFKRALAEARRRKYVAPVGRGRRSNPEITELGRKRLRAVTPMYQKKRPWDRRIYLVTYDIPEIRHRDRDYLRKYLTTIGCGKLQASVWITPYDPKVLVEEFVNKHTLSGTVIVSNTGIDGSIGDEDIQTLVARIYHLEEINTSHERWISSVRSQNITPDQFLSYLAILQTDPQLPFILLPRYWKGDKAYALIESFMKRIGK